MIYILMWLIVVLLILVFFMGASESEMGILRPLDLKRSNIKATLSDEIYKCIEEDKEFVIGALRNDIDNTIEEFWDSVQTKLNVMAMMGIPTEVIYEDLDKHIKKMHKRGYKFKD